MDELPEFEQALSSFRSFLTTQGHPDDVFWVYRDDLWFRKGKPPLIVFPSGIENKTLVEKVYEEGRKRGLVEIVAVAKAGGLIAATVWFPRFPEEEVQGWPEGLKLSVSLPLSEGKLVAPFTWNFVRYLPAFKRYQKSEKFIATRDWAAS